MSKATAKRVAYQAALDVLKNNWNQGIINTEDVRGYIRVIDEGNAEFRGTIYEAPMRKAIADFLAHVQKHGLQSGKPTGSLSGLEGLDGFLKSVWKGVKKAVGGVVATATKVVSGVIKTVTGEAGKAGDVIVQSAQPQTQGQQPTYQAAGSNNTLLYVALAGLAAIVLMKR